MIDQEKIEKGAEEIVQFINKVMEGIKIPQLAKPQRTVNHINISVVIHQPQKGWLRRQLAKVF
jgi:hypothetical protein